MFSPTGPHNSPYTSDPNNPTLQTTLLGTAVSTIEGNICDVAFDAINSPFSMTNDIVVAAGCLVNVEAGVTVDFQGFDIVVEEGGQLNFLEGSAILNHENSSISNDGVLAFSGTEGNVFRGDMNINELGQLIATIANGRKLQRRVRIIPTILHLKTQDGQSTPRGIYEPSSYGYYRLYYNYNGSSDYNWHFITCIRI